MNKGIENSVVELRLLENQIMQLEQQKAMLNQQLMQFQALQKNLDEIKTIKSQKEILVPLSKDIFIRSKLESGDKVLVNVGAKVMLEKNIEGAKTSVENQKQKFAEAEREINREIDQILKRISHIEQEVQKISKK